MLKTQYWRKSTHVKNSLLMKNPKWSLIIWQVTYYYIHSHWVVCSWVLPREIWYTLYIGCSDYEHSNTVLVNGIEAFQLGHQCALHNCTPRWPLKLDSSFTSHCLWSAIGKVGLNTIALIQSTTSSSCQNTYMLHVHVHVHVLIPCLIAYRKCVCFCAVENFYSVISTLRSCILLVWGM